VSQSSEFCRIILCVASQRVFTVVSVYFIIDCVRKLLDTPSYSVCGGGYGLDSSGSGQGLVAGCVEHGNSN
jgi:hypothetical protein